MTITTMTTDDNDRRLHRASTAGIGTRIGMAWIDTTDFAWTWNFIKECQHEVLGIPILLFLPSLDLLRPVFLIHGWNMLDEGVELDVWRRTTWARVYIQNGICIG